MDEEERLRKEEVDRETKLRASDFIPFRGIRAYDERTMKLGIPESMTNSDILRGFNILGKYNACVIAVTLVGACSGLYCLVKGLVK